ncbi:MAG: hypothetical protein OXI81_02885, partial [Paracoccaceae bacterium]|nr:hypothetical protein [Paracoccaceae bacterium]
QPSRGSRYSIDLMTVGIESIDWRNAEEIVSLSWTSNLVRVNNSGAIAPREARACQTQVSEQGGSPFELATACGGFNHRTLQIKMEK